MKILLGKFKFFIIILLLLSFCGKGIAQTYTITGDVNSSTLSCSTFTGYKTISIGNGTTTPSNLIMNDNLDIDLACSPSLGPLQIIINNATIDFSTANKRLYLPEGSSITFLNGGILNPPGGNGGGCTGNDRIYIGGFLLATCQGSAGLLGFDDLIALGGTGSATSNSPVCNTDTINLSVTPPPNGGPFTYSWTGPNGFTSTMQNPTITNAAVANAGQYTVVINSPTLATLGSPLAIKTTVVVNSGVSTTIPTVTLTQPTCTVATGTITIVAPTGIGMTYSINGLTYTNTTGVFSSLPTGTYNVTAKNSSGCISNVRSATINATANIWNGTTWLNGTPTSTQVITFNGTYDLTGDLTGCSCTVNSGAVTIKTGNNLILGGKLTVNTPGTLIFEDSASLVQTTSFTGSNSGNIIYMRNISSAITTDYTYWSSPVVNQNLNLSPYYTAGMFYSYNDFGTPEDWLKVTAATIMLPSKGYIARGPVNALPPGLYDATFTGVPNNGLQSIAVSGGVKSALIGNPYPSAIDADTFLSANSAVIDGTLYFWTHNTALQDRNNILSTAGSGALAYTSNDYAVYNLTGGVVIDGVTYVQGGTTAPTGGAKPTGKIAAGQSFFTTTTVAGGTVNFTNAMRLAGTTNPGGTGTNQQFFKTKNPNTKTSKVVEKHRIWLNLSNSQGAFKQTLIGYITDATNELDSRFDGESFDGNEFVDFYSINQDKNLVIQGRALPFDGNDEVPLGYRTTISGDFTINIDEVDGLLNNQNVFIEDKLTNKIVNLKEGNYTFNTTAGTFDNRFVLRYIDKTLGTTDINAEENNVLVSIKNKQIKINSVIATIDEVTIFDLLGRQIYQKNKVNSNQLLLSDFVSSNQTLIVKTSLQNGTTVTEKVIY